MSKTTHKGTVKFFNEQKGWGFIIDDSNGTEFFVHQRGLNSAIREGDKVEFALAEGKNKQKGLTCIDVKKI